MDKEMSISRDLALSPSKGANFPYFYIWNTRSLQPESFFRHFVFFDIFYSRIVMK